MSHKDHGVSNHQQHDCFLSNELRQTRKKIKHHTTSPFFMKVPPQRSTGNVESISILCCHEEADHWYWYLNTLRPRQNGRHFPDDIFKCIFLNENVSITIKFSLKFPRAKLTIFQHWFGEWLGAKQATSHYLNQGWTVYWHIYASLSLNELRCIKSESHKINPVFFFNFLFFNVVPLAVGQSYGSFFN